MELSVVQSSFCPPLEQDLCNKVIDSLPEGFLLSDSEGRITWYNAWAARLLEISPDEMKGLLWIEVFPVEYREMLRAKLLKALAGHSSQDLEVTLAGSRVKNLLLCLCPLGREYAGQVLITVRDWGERKKQFDLLLEQNCELSATLQGLQSDHSRLKESSARLEILSIFDELTRLHNRRFFSHQAKVEFDRCLRYGSPMGILMMDLDHFKTVNDEMGHVFGDAVLSQAGLMIMGAVRMADLAARYGGEEFVILAPETRPEGLKVLAERLRKTFEEHTFIHEGQTRKVTISIGGCSYSVKKYPCVEDMVEDADKALYKAKEKRNCVVCLEESD